MADALSGIEAAERTQREETERRQAERAAAETVATEKARIESWFNHRLETALAGGDTTFSTFLSGDLERHRNPKNIPAGWPPGAAPYVSQVEVVLDDCDRDEDKKHVSQTALWKAVRRQGVTPPGYKPNGYRKGNPAA